MSGPLTLGRDCPAVLVPAGTTVVLPEGSQVVVLQNLGGNVTVQSEVGQLARIAAVDADALGLGVPEAAPSGTSNSDVFSAEAVIDALKTVYDPEIPINVVDLGLVYACEPRRLDDGSYLVEIKMSMTAPGCGMGDVLKEEARCKVAAVPGVGGAEVELVWDPPWDQSRLSEEARLELGMW